MRKYLMALVLSLTGCVTLQTDPQRYWRVECGRVATVQSPALVNPQSGVIQSQALGAGPMGPQLLTQAGPALMAQPGPASDCGPRLPYPRAMGSPSDPCACDVLLQRLDRLERKVDLLGGPRKME